MSRVCQYIMAANTPTYCIVHTMHRSGHLLVSVPLKLSLVSYVLIIVMRLANIIDLKKVIFIRLRWRHDNFRHAYSTLHMVWGYKHITEAKNPRFWTSTHPLSDTERISLTPPPSVFRTTFMDLPLPPGIRTPALKGKNRALSAFRNLALWLCQHHRISRNRKRINLSTLHNVKKDFSIFQST